MRLLDQAAASLDGSTGEDLGPAFKRYRQAVFKLNYKINKLKDGKKGGANVRSALPPPPLPVSIVSVASCTAQRCLFEYRHMMKKLLPSCDVNCRRLFVLILERSILGLWILEK